MLPAVESAIAAHRARRARIAAAGVPDEPIDLKRKPKVKPVEKMEAPVPKPTVIRGDDLYSYIEPPSPVWRRPYPRHIQRAVVLTIGGLGVDDLLAHRRTAVLNWPRQISIFMCKKILNLSYPQLGRVHGQRDHTTALHACRRFEERFAADPATIETITAILNLLRAQHFIVPELAELGLQQPEADHA